MAHSFVLSIILIHSASGFGNNVQCQKVVKILYERRPLLYVGIFFFAQIEKCVFLGLNFQQVCIVMKRFRSMYVTLVGKAQLTVVSDDNW